MSSEDLIALAAVDFVGEGLNRPECALCLSDGSVWVSNWDGGVSRIESDGAVTHFLAQGHGFDLKPNGIALERQGSFLIANLGDDGGVWRLALDGHLTEVCREVDGVALPPSNFVLVDAQDRIWITVSTRLEPRARAYRSDVADGFMIVVDHNGARIAADNLGYTNECQIHPNGDWMYVNETFARRLSRFPLSADGRLGKKETVCEFGPGIFPDGLCFDQEGGVWITSIISNSVLRVSPDGAIQTVIQDADADHLKWVEDAYQSHEIARPHLDTIKSEKLQNISSLAFGGNDLRTGFLGCLLGRNIASFESPVAGIAPVHWDWRPACPRS